MSSQRNHFLGSEQGAHLPELSKEKPPLPNSEEKKTWPVQMGSVLGPGFLEANALTIPFEPTGRDARDLTVQQPLRSAAIKAAGTKTSNRAGEEIRGVEEPSRCSC
jgi:hypothetical protein